MIENISLECWMSPNTRSSWYNKYDLERLFQALQMFPSIRRIDGLDAYNLGSVDPCLLASVLGKLDMLRLVMDSNYETLESDYGQFVGNLSKAQLEQVYAAIAERNKPMKTLSIFSRGVTDLGSTLFNSAVSNTNELELWWYWEEEQIQALLFEIAQGDRHLKTLKMFNCTRGKMQETVVMGEGVMDVQWQRKRRNVMQNMFI